MAASNFKLHDKAKEYFGDNTVDLDAGDGYFAMVLLDSGWTADLTDDTYADISTDELSTALGYTVGGVILSGTTWVESGGDVSFDCNDPAWVAAGGSLVARFAAWVHVAAGSGLPQSTDKVLAHCLLDDTPADLTATDGVTLKIAVHADGLYKVSGGNT